MASSTVITAIDYSGRQELRGGILYRRTVDAAAPTDTPPASVSFLHETAAGLYLWSRNAYVPLSALLSVVTGMLADGAVTGPKLATALTLTDGSTLNTGTGTGLKIGTGSTQKVGFFNASPVVRPAALTQTYATADRTLGAYTPNAQGSAYTGAADSEAKLVDLNSLRVAVENLRSFTEDIAQLLNAVVDDLQALGLEQ